MGNHFKPRPNQLKEEYKKKKGEIHYYNNSLYRVMYIPRIFTPWNWYKSKKKSQTTDYFLIGFRIDTDTDEIENFLREEFGNNISKISRQDYLYIVDLADKITWGEIERRVDKALKDVFDVIG